MQVVPLVRQGAPPGTQASAPLHERRSFHGTHRENVSIQSNPSRQQTSPDLQSDASSHAHTSPAACSWEESRGAAQAKTPSISVQTCTPAVQRAAPQAIVPCGSPAESAARRSPRDAKGADCGALVAAPDNTGAGCWAWAVARDEGGAGLLATCGERGQASMEAYAQTLTATRPRRRAPIAESRMHASFVKSTARVEAACPDAAR
jgi:hypothetical protein